LVKIFEFRERYRFRATYLGRQLGGTDASIQSKFSQPASMDIFCDNVDFNVIIDLIQLLFSYTFLYASSCTWTRISILFFYKRIFSPLEIYLKVALAVAGFLTISYPIVIWVTMSTACKPVSHFWTQFSGTEGNCIDVNKFFLALGIINMINDVIILVIPFPRIIQLQMSTRKKIAICAIMAVGVL
jgi:hypothetical protein